MGSSSTQQTQSSTQPWQPQAQALQNVFNQAGGALAQAQSNAQSAPPPVNYTAGATPSEQNLYNQEIQYGTGANTNGLMSAGNTATNSGASGIASAIQGLTGYNPAASNNPAALAAAANQYVQGQNIPAEVAQAMQGATEQARDVTIPGITQNANATGNADSSRAGIAQGLVQRGLAENAQNLSGSLSSQAYQQGLNLAENQANANNTAALSALTGLGNIGNAALGQGNSAINGAISGMGNIFGIEGNGAQGQQAANQATLTNQAQQYQAGQTDPFAALGQYLGLVGSNNWGGQTQGTTTTQSNPGAASIIAGLLGGVGGTASTLGGLGWKPLANGFGGLFGANANPFNTTGSLY